MSRGRTQKPAHHVSPRGRIDATPPSRVAGFKTAKRRRNDSRASRRRWPLTPRERRLVAILSVKVAEKGISHSEAGRRAGVDPADARRVLAFGEATPRTLRRLFDTFKISEHKKIRAADRREALLLELRAAVERQAELLDELVTLAGGDRPAF